MDNKDLARVKNNIALMYQQGATDEEMTEYVDSEGYTKQEIATFNPDEKDEPTIGKLKEKIEENPALKKSAIIMTELAKSPIGKLSLRLAGKTPEEINQVLSEFEPEAITPGEKAAKTISSTGANIMAAGPIMKAIGAVPLIAKVPDILKMAAGLGAFSGTSKAIEGGTPGEIMGATAGGAVTGLATGGLMKAGASVIPKFIPGAERIGSAAGGLLAGKMMGVEDEDTLFLGAMGAIFPSQRADFSKMGISKLRDYAGNKVPAIREGAKRYWRQEVERYGQDIRSLTKDNQPLQVDPLFEGMTKQMLQRGLYDPQTEKWVKPLTPADRAFVKSYEMLFRKIKTSGKITTGDVITEYQNIKDSAKLGTPEGRDAFSLAKDMLDTISNQIENEKFKNANINYAKFRNRFDLLDKAVDVFGNPLETGKGEKFLTGGGLGKTKEARLTAKIIEEETGQSLKGAKFISKTKGIIRKVPFIGEAVTR